jgi:hypothetical protein
MSSHIYGFDSTNHNWEPVKITDAGKLEVSSALDTTGLATDTLQTAGNASLTSLDTKVTTCDTGNVSGSIAVTGVSGTVTVDGSGSTQPVSGTFFQATQPVSASALPLPTGAATEASLATIAACENGGQALQVDIQADAVGLATSALQTAGNSSLTALENCVDTGVNEIAVVIQKKVDELNENAYVTETVSVASLSMSNTITLINCTSYAKVEVIAVGSLSANSTHVQIQWSDDDSNWYKPDFYQSLMTSFDADGTSNSEESVAMSMDVRAKYMRVRIYNPSSTQSESVKCLVSRIH